MNIDFESWLNKPGEYALQKTYKDGLRQAYIAGFNACRDKWGGMDYDETLYWENFEGDAK